MLETLKIAAIATFMSFSWYDKSIPLNELKCVADTVYHEARGEPPKGQIRVAQVVKNRMDVNTWTACEIVKQKKQFAYVKIRHRAPFEQEQYELALVIAYQVLTSGIVDDTGVFYFDNKTPQKARPWFKQALRQGKIEVVETIGNHTFYRQK